MAYEEAKVYFDGSHYIAIPHTTRPSKPRLQRTEEAITVYEEEETKTSGQPETETSAPEEKKAKGRTTTRKELFEKLYKETHNKRRAERKRLIIEAMRPYFPDEERTELYVTANLQRKQRNLICRRIRMVRKANLQAFNYFCTFTYDDKKHTEESFRRKFKMRLATFVKRKGWKYMGVWERSPTTDRLHFHGLFYIPEGTLPGELITVKDYSTTAHKMQIRQQSTYFNEAFGRSDFEEIVGRHRLSHALTYLMKYLEKSGEKIVYSRGLPQYFISDILDSDVICNVGEDDPKLILFDNFSCFDQGVYVGEVSPEVIAQLRKSN